MRASSSLIDREAELAVIRTALDRAADRRPGVVLVDGGAGMGKTSLLRNVDGPRVLRAGGDENETSYTYGVLEQLLGQAPETAADPAVAGALLLARMTASDEPLVVVVDDAHWADTASLISLTFALRRLRDDPVLAIIACRTEELHRLPHGLLTLAMGEGGTRITLHGLDDRGITALGASVGVRIAPAMTARLREATEGNPLHLRALFAEVDLNALPEGLPLPAPRSFAAMTLGRLANCTPQTRELAAVVAVLGMRAELATIARIAGSDAPADALDDAVRAGLLEAFGAVVSFTHPLVRAAIYHDLGPARRSALHERAAAVLDDRASSLRHRVAASTGDDPVLAEELASFSRERIVAYDFDAASDAAVTASRLHPERRRRERLVVDAATWRAIAGDAMPALQLAADGASFEDETCRSYLQAFVHSASRQPEQAVALLERAWDLAGDDEDFRAMIAMQATIACIGHWRPDSRAALWARRAIASDSLGRIATAAPCAVAWGLVEDGRCEEAEAYFSAAPDLPAWHLGRGVLQALTGALGSAREHLLAAMDGLRTRGSLFSWMLTLFWLAEAEYRLGEWDDAIKYAELVASIAEDRDFPWVLAALHAVAVPPLAARGEWEAADAHLSAARDGLRVLPGWINEWATERAAAALAFAHGDRTAAKDRRGDPAASPEESEEDVRPFERALIRLERGERLRREGRRTDAQEALLAAKADLERLGARPFLARVDRELAACGLRPTSRKGDDGRRLTPQERTVASLVARGRTNREVAAELVVSLRTVEYHLSNVYAKLGIRSRVELVRRLDEPQ